MCIFRGSVVTAGVQSDVVVFIPMSYTAIALHESND